MARVWCVAVYALDFRPERDPAGRARAEGTWGKTRNHATVGSHRDISFSSRRFSLPSFLKVLLRVKPSRKNYNLKTFSLSLSLSCAFILHARGRRTFGDRARVVVLQFHDLVASVTLTSERDRGALNRRRSIR